MWTAGGKTFLKLIENLTRYLLVFLALIYLPNSQNYKMMKLTTCQGSKLGQNLSMLWNSLCLCRQGKSNVDSGGSHVFVPPDEI